MCFEDFPGEQVAQVAFVIFWLMKGLETLDIMIFELLLIRENVALMVGHLHSCLGPNVGILYMM